MFGTISLINPVSALRCLWRALYTQDHQTILCCHSETDLWQEFPKASLTSLWSAKCLSENLTLICGVYADQFIDKSNCPPDPGFCCRCMWWGLIFWGKQDIAGSWLQLWLVSLLFSRFGENSHLFSGDLYGAQIKDFYYILITKRTMAYSGDQSHRFFWKLKNLEKLKNLLFFWRLLYKIQNEY